MSISRTPNNKTRPAEKIICKKNKNKLMRNCFLLRVGSVQCQVCVLCVRMSHDSPGSTVTTLNIGLAKLPYPL